MKLCIPVEADLGLESPVCAHFGSAPYFMIVEVESGAHRAIENRNAHHQHGACAPLAALAGERVDGWIVGGIGMGALRKLEAADARVFRAEQATVAATLAAYAAGALRPMDRAAACAGHGHEHA
jgi:predicted Fe-Mo cluster-binding NifX family protein